MIFFIKIAVKVKLYLTSVLKELFTNSIYFWASWTSLAPISHLFSGLKKVSVLASLFKSISDTVRYGTVSKPRSLNTFWVTLFFSK